MYSYYSSSKCSFRRIDCIKIKNMLLGIAKNYRGAHPLPPIVVTFTFSPITAGTSRQKVYLIGRLMI